MDLATESNPAYADELRLTELLRALGRAKWAILIFTLVATVSVAIASWLLPKKYSASVILSPVTDTNGSFGTNGVSTVLSQFSGLASLAGISSSGDSKKFESIAVLQSEELTQQYIHTNHLLRVLFPSKWDKLKQRWIVGKGITVPTLWEGNRYFVKKVRTVTTDAKTGLITLTITWANPQTAAKWANDLVRLTNAYLQNKAINESERHIAYLNQQAAKTDLVPVRQAISALLQNEINRQMLARGTEEYAFKVLDPAFPPEIAASPKPLLWILISFFGSLLISFFVVFIRVAWVRA